MIFDLTGSRAGTDPAAAGYGRGRYTQVFNRWLVERDQAWRQGLGSSRSALPGQADPAHRRQPAHRHLNQRLKTLFAADEDVEVDATWRIYRRVIAAHRSPDRTRVEPP